MVALTQWSLGKPGPIVCKKHTPSLHASSKAQPPRAYCNITGVPYTLGCHDFDKRLIANSVQMKSKGPNPILCKQLKGQCPPILATAQPPFHCCYNIRETTAKEEHTCCALASSTTFLHSQHYSGCQTHSIAKTPYLKTNSQHAHHDSEPHPGSHLDLHHPMVGIPSNFVANICTLLHTMTHTSSFTI